MPTAPVRKPADVLDRDAEWALLADLFASSRPELAFVLGRRRVGKTFLLAPFARAVEGLYYQATRRTGAEQLRELSRLLAERFEDAALEHGSGLSDWPALLRYVHARAGNAPFLLVLDEFPYLVDAAPELPSVLQAFLDHEGRTSRLKLVLCGSAITAMQRLEGPDQPLYARRTARLHLRPFGIRELGGFLPRYDARDSVRAYTAFGGLPGHLALLDPGQDFPINVARRLLDPQARLYDEAQHMLDAFLGDAKIHYSILAAIAAGNATWSGITKAVGKPGGSLSRPMEWLRGMEFVRRVVPVTEGDAARTRRAIYRIRDPYVAFWHRFVAPIVRRGGRWVGTPEALYDSRVAPYLDDAVGPVFEECWRQALPRLEDLPFRPVEVGEWWRPREQIDVVALGEDEQVLLGEVKWGSVDRHDLAALRRRVAAFLEDHGGSPRVHLALFSGRGLADEDTRAAVARGEVLHWDVEALTG